MTSPARPHASRTKRFQSPRQRRSTRVPITGKQLVSYTKLRRRWEAKQRKKAGPVVPYGEAGPWSPQSNFLARNSLIALPPPRTQTPPPPLSPRGLKPTAPPRPQPMRRRAPEPPQDVGPQDVPIQEVDLRSMSEEEQLEYAIAMSTGAPWPPVRTPAKSTSSSLKSGFLTEDEQLALALQESMRLSQPPKRPEPKRPAPPPPKQDIKAILERIEKSKGRSWKSFPPKAGLKLLPVLEDEDYDSEVAIAMSLEQPIPPRLYAAVVDNPKAIADFQTLRRRNQLQQSMYERRPLESPPPEGHSYVAPAPAPVPATKPPSGRGQGSRFFSSILESAMPGSRLRQDSAAPIASAAVAKSQEPHSALAPAPLHNLRATCYMNSYLQVFMSLQEYNDRFQEILNTAQARYIEFGVNELPYLDYISPYSNFYWAYQSHRGSKNGSCMTQDLRNMFISIGALSQDFQDSTSEQDTMQLIMIAIDRCIDNFQQLGLGMNAAEEFLRVAFAYLDTCNKCNNLSIRGELDTGIRLDIPGVLQEKVPCTVQDCIDHTFSLTEDLPRTCDKCQHRGAARSLQVASIGTFVFFSLKRFPAASTKSNKMIRVNGTINLPMVNPETGAPVELVKLNLRAVICHVGMTISSGHYFAYVYNLPDRKWYQCNDSSINQVLMADSSVIASINNNAFVMVYEKRSSS